MAQATVKTEQIADGAITAAKIADGAIVAAELASNSVTTAKIADDAVTSAKLDTNIAIAGTLDVAGNVVFNEGSADVDFRVESNGSANMLFVDGGNNEVLVQKAASGGTATAGSVLIVEGDDNTELSLLGGSSSILAINFGHSGDVDDAIIAYNTTSGSENMAFTVNAAERMRIDASGNVGIGTSSPKALNGQTSLTINNNVPRIDFKVGDAFKHHILCEAEYIAIAADADDNQHNSRILLETDGTERMRITSDGISVTGTVTQSTAKTAQYTGQYDGRETNTITLGSLGFKPQVLFCIFNVGTTQKASWGMAARDGGHQVLLDYDAQASADGYEASTSFFGRLAKGSSAFSNLAVSAWNSDNVVLQKSISNGGSAATCAYKIIVMG